MHRRTHTTCWIRARYRGRCRCCGGRVHAGDVVLWSSRRHAVACGRCAQSSQTAIDRYEIADPVTAAGGAAAREYRRRRTSRAARLRRGFGRLGALLSAVTEPTHQRVWARGAHGERPVARRLASPQLAGSGVVLLHDRRLPHGRANFDHIAVGPAGVLVIDSKNLRGTVRRDVVARASGCASVITTARVS